VVPADTFDNVKGEFPIGFFIWNLGAKMKFLKKIILIFMIKKEILLEQKN
jgi:hypothetical protein